VPGDNVDGSGLRISLGGETREGFFNPRWGFFLLLVFLLIVFLVLVFLLAAVLPRTALFVFGALVERGFFFATVFLGRLAGFFFAMQKV
jgi:hypothetical protein